MAKAILLPQMEQNSGKGIATNTVCVGLFPPDSQGVVRILMCEDGRETNKNGLEPEVVLFRYHVQGKNEPTAVPSRT